MTDKFTISTEVTTNSADNPVGLEVWLDNNLVHDFILVTGPTPVIFDVADDDGEHELRFVLKNKTQDHTKIDEQGNIVADSVITINKIMFDGIDLGHGLTEQSVYTHNFNGNGPETQEKFYGTMGCNGTVSLKFTTPVYLWLLENL